MKRLRVYGDKTAIIYTALAFGLFHGNINQIPFTIACGLVLGYTLVKTNNIKYTILLHIMLNSIAVILTLLMQYELIIPIFGILVFILASILFTVIYLPIRLATRKQNIPNESKYDRKKLFINFGSIFTVMVVILLSVIEAII